MSEGGVPSVIGQIGPVANGRHHGERQHAQRHVPMPAVSGPRFVVVEAELVLAGLDVVVDRPAMAFHVDRCFDAGPVRTPRRKVGQGAVGDGPTDQEAAGPGRSRRFVQHRCVEVGEFAAGPVVQPRPRR